MNKVKFAATGIVLAGVLMVFAQQDTLHSKLKMALSENDEYLHILETMDKNIIENAKVLIHNMETKKALFLETANFQCNEMGRCLDSSEDYLTRLQKVTDIAMDEIQVAYYAGVHKHYKNAIKAHKDLQTELAKAAPAKTVVQMDALTIYNEITSAENERNELQHKMDIKEPEMKTVKH